MPLIIAVVIIIVLFVNAHDSTKASDLKKGNDHLALRKTNAKLEARFVNDFMQEGRCLAKALKLAQKKIAQNGFVPCLKPEDFGTQYSNDQSVCKEGEETSYVGRPERFDSAAVQDRRRALEHIGQPVTDETIYEDFPTNWDVECRRTGIMLSAYKKGTYITKPGMGTLEIIDYSFSFGYYSTGTYTVRDISTGEIIDGINIRDKSIRVIR